MSFALTAAAHRLNPDVFSRVSLGGPDTVPAPKADHTLDRLASLLDKVALNPQPLPPKASAISLASKFADDDWCGTVPHKLPHFPPPPPAPWADLVNSALALR